jgi:hypothetical protein
MYVFRMLQCYCAVCHCVMCLHDDSQVHLVQTPQDTNWRRLVFAVTNLADYRLTQYLTVIPSDRDMSSVYCFAISVSGVMSDGCNTYWWTHYTNILLCERLVLKWRHWVSTELLTLKV